MGEGGAREGRGGAAERTGPGSKGGDAQGGRRSRRWRRRRRRWWEGEEGGEGGDGGGGGAEGRIGRGLRRRADPNRVDVGVVDDLRVVASPRHAGVGLGGCLGLGQRRVGDDHRPRVGARRQRLEVHEPDPARANNADADGVVVHHGERRRAGRGGCAPRCALQRGRGGGDARTIAPFMRTALQQQREGGRASKKRKKAGGESATVRCLYGLPVSVRRRTRRSCIGH